MGCGSRVAGSLLAMGVMFAATAATMVDAAERQGERQGWRPEVRSETDAEWLTRLDRSLAPVHGTIRDTLTLLGAGVSPAEQDAYVVIIQEQAAKGISVLDDMEPAPACARDYAALARTMMLMWGDSADAWRQSRAGSTQAAAEVGGLVQAAGFMLSGYGDTIRGAACVTVEPAPVVTAIPQAARTPTPMRSPG